MAQHIDEIHHDDIQLNIFDGIELSQKFLASLPIVELRTSEFILPAVALKHRGY